mmetsp:Transcript_17481/g.26038  ORF Transcript_17481/g.26038 Transcript_17481/m.26038 type:complete len:107 (-) Transcript_17481:1603-1923(-)
MPERLRPLPHKTRGKRIYKYQNLTGKKLTMEEKLWLLKEVDFQFGDRPGQNRTKKGLVRRYGLYKKFFARNWKTYKEYQVAKNRGRWQAASKPDQLSRVKSALAIA